MRFSLLLTELKVFTRAISSLGKLGDEIYFECSPREFSLRCVNSSRSAFAVIYFYECFFEKSRLLTDTPVRFKLNTKTCLKVFKQTMNWDRVLQRCKMWLDSGHSRLIVQFFQRHGIVKTYNLPIIECENLEAVYDLKDCTCQIVMSSKVAGEIMQNFRPTQTEVTIDMRSSECIFRNYVPDTESTSVTTHIPVPCTDFDAYRLNEECDLTFCQKDFRAALLFGVSMNALLVLNCSRPGKPIVLAFTDDKNYKAHFVLSTLPLPYFPKRNPSFASGSLAAKVQETSNKSSTTFFIDESHPPDNRTMMMAPTQVLPPSAPSSQRTQVNASTPLSVQCENTDPPLPKKMRSVLFSNFCGESEGEDSFFRNPPPAHPPVNLIANTFNDVDLDTTVVDEGDEGVSAGTRPAEAAKGGLTARLATDLRAVATAGWDTTSSLGVGSVSEKRKSTILVPDSDEEL